MDYGQRHRVELDSAREIGASLAERHIVVPLDLRAFGGSALTSEIDYAGAAPYALLLIVLSLPLTVLLRRQADRTLAA